MKHALKIAAALSLAYTPVHAASNAAPWGLDSSPSPHVLTLYSDGAWNVFAKVLGSGGNQNITWPGSQTFQSYPVFTATSAVNGIDLTATTFSGCAFKSPNGFCVTQAGVPQSPAFPGLSLNVAGTTNIAGLDMSNCTSPLTCGWMVYSTPTSGSHAYTSTLRVQKAFPNTGSGVGVSNALWTLGSSGTDDTAYIWLNQTEFHNRTKASTGAQNVALAGTNIKELGPNAPGTVIGPSWALYGECYDTTGKVNPTTSCLGAEIDTYAVVGAGTDTNKQRVALQINGGVNNGVDAGVHIGALLLMGSNNGAVIDNGIITGAMTMGKFLDTTATTFTGNVLNLTNFTVDGSGNMTTYGTVSFGNTTSVALSVAGRANFQAGTLNTPVAIASLPTCNAAARGLEMTVTNGVQYGAGGYGTAVGGTSTVVRKVMCSDNAGVGVYGWYYN